MSDLKLYYSFIATPFPIRASAKGANPNQIVLQVMIDRHGPGSAPITVESIEIQIPMDSPNDHVLSTQTALPSPSYDPVYDCSSLWHITTPSTGGNTVTIKPQPGTSGTVNSSIIFYLGDINARSGITVNEAPGFVDITITERYTPKLKIVDIGTYKLEKLDTGYPVTNFSADDPVLRSLGPTTIHWNCSDEGKNFVYGLRSDDSDWGTYDCLNGGTCLTWQQGKAGVATPDLGKDTVFTLDVITTDSKGNQVRWTPPPGSPNNLSFKVRMEAPFISPQSFVKQYFSGRIAGLHWLASNAARCTVQIDSETVADNLPADTAANGYYLRITGAPRDEPYQPSLLAYSRIGNTPVGANLLPAVRIDPLEIISTGLALQTLAITPDGKSVLGTTSYRESALADTVCSVKIIDLTTTPYGFKTILFDTGLTQAIATNGTLALVLNNANNVSVIDLPGGTVRPSPITVPNGSVDITITPDGKFALVLGFYDSTVTVIDLTTPTPAVKTTVTSVEHPYHVAVTPDSKLALVTTDLDKVWVINLDNNLDNKWTVEPNGIPIPVSPPLNPGLPPTDITITADGTLALVSNLGGTVSVIDIANRRRAYPDIPCGSSVSSPVSLAVTPDGNLALVASGGEQNLLTAFRIGDPLAQSLTIPIGWYASPTSNGIPVKVRISETGNVVIVAMSDASLIKMTLLE